MIWNPELKPNGKYGARPRCEVCKRLVVRRRCDDCGKKLCGECGAARAGGAHACPEHVDQLPLPFQPSIYTLPGMGNG